jgi:gamma-glutamyltranspeptidase/glutathione hydrolase
MLKEMQSLHHYSDNYGSKIYCDELGFFLNNQMDDFSAKAGVPNLYGLTGSEANSIAPGKGCSAR